MHANKNNPAHDGNAWIGTGSTATPTNPRNSMTGANSWNKPMSIVFTDVVAKYKHRRAWRVKVASTFTPGDTENKRSSFYKSGNVTFPMNSKEFFRWCWAQCPKPDDVARKSAAKEFFMDSLQQTLVLISFLVSLNTLM